MRRLLNFLLLSLTPVAAALAQTATPDAGNAKTLDAIQNVMLEVEHLPWLFCAFALAFMLIFGYLFQIAQKEKKLRHRIAELQEMMEERWKKKT